MEPFILRLEEESSDLEAKLEKIIAFMDSDKFDSLSDEEQSDIENQYSAMSIYLDILNKRIEYQINKIENEHY